MLATLLLLCAARHPATAQAPDSIPPRANAEAISAYLDRVEAAGFSGVVLGAVRDRVVIHRALGLADPAAGVRYDSLTPSYIGSVTKQFTAAAILKLQEEGRLSVRDSIGRFFRDAPPDKSGITIHQLLTHTSGLSDTVGDRYGQAIGKAEMLRRLFAAPLEMRPGTSWSYSNPNYVLLAAIVESASGLAYERYVVTKLFRPARLTRTGYHLGPAAEKAIAHTRRGTTDLGSPFNRSRLRDGPTWALRGAGGMVSTAGDLFKWHLALERGRILSAGSRKAMFSPQVPTDSGGVEFYGYGWDVLPESPRGGLLVGHNGSDGGNYATIVHFVDKGVLVIVLANGQPPGFRRVESALIRALFERLTGAQARPVNASPVGLRPAARAPSRGEMPAATRARRRG